MLIYYCLVNRLWACRLIDDASRSPNQIGIRRLIAMKSPMARLNTPNNRQNSTSVTIALAISLYPTRVHPCGLSFSEALRLILAIFRRSICANVNSSGTGLGLSQFMARRDGDDPAYHGDLVRGPGSDRPE